MNPIYYGNIGAPDRLDLTLIGPAVKSCRAAGKARLQARERGGDFAAAAPERLNALGPHRLRGVSEAQEVFALLRLDGG